jgi:peptidyl-prolyl cis-trans isomerase D
MIETVFHTAKDGVNSAEGNQPTNWIVFRITGDQIPPPDPKSASAKQMDQKIQRDISDDVFGQYMASVEDELGTKVNQQALAQAFGNGTPETN